MTSGSTSSSRPSPRWQSLDRPTAEARLFPLAQFMVDVYAAALLVEQAGLGAGRARLRSQGSSLPGSTSGPTSPTPARSAASTLPPEELERFKDLCDGAFVDERIS